MKTNKNNTTILRIKLSEYNQKLGFVSNNIFSDVLNSFLFTFMAKYNDILRKYNVNETDYDSTFTLYDNTSNKLFILGDSITVTKRKCCNMRCSVGSLKKYPQMNSSPMINESFDVKRIVVFEFRESNEYNHKQREITILAADFKYF